MAHTPSGADPHRHIRYRMGSGMGRPKREIRERDVVRIPPGRKHWHGATATTTVAHIAIQEQLDGKVVDWLEKVSDEQYRKEFRAEDIHEHLDRRRFA